MKYLKFQFFTPTTNNVAIRSECLFEIICMRQIFYGFLWFNAKLSVQPINSTRIILVLF